jgi:hypothetical protein
MSSRMLTTCIPLESFWDPTVHGKCIRLKQFCIASGLLHVFLDVFILNGRRLLDYGTTYQRTERKNNHYLFTTSIKTSACVQRGSRVSQWDLNRISRSALSPTPDVCQKSLESLGLTTMNFNYLQYHRPTHYLRPTYTSNFRSLPTISPPLKACILYLHPELSHR